MVSTKSMKAFVVGATGGVGRLLVDQLVEQKYQVHATYRKQEDRAKLEEQGATPIQMDLIKVSKETLTKEMEGFRHIFFTAGSGGANVQQVDRDGAIKVAEALKNVAYTDPHFIVLSSIGVDQAEKMGDLEQYGKAKKEADDSILAMQTSLHSTIVRPGGLTDEDAKKSIIFNGGVVDAKGEPLLANNSQCEKSLMETKDQKKIINTRADVASVLLAVAEIFYDDSKPRVFEMIQGNEDNEGCDIRKGLSAMI